MDTNKKARNGTIELFRILFCCIILSFHFSKDIYGSDLSLGFFRNGGVCVELFFMISGFFLCRSAYKFANSRENESIPQKSKQSINNDYTKESIRFIVNKVKPFLFYHIILNTFMLIYNAIKYSYTFEKILTLLPTYLFLPVTGFSDYGWIMGSEWYIGHMLFAMVIIYPFMIRWPDQISKYIAPIIGAVLYGYLMKEHHSIIGSNDTVRAFAGIMLGIAAFQGSEWIKKKYPDKKLSIISVLAFPVIVCFIAYVGSHLKGRSVQPVWVVLMWFAMMVTFAERGVLSSTGLLNNSFVYYLGAVSLPIYMVQNVTRHLVIDIFYSSNASTNIIMEFGLTIACGILFYYIHALIQKIMKSTMAHNIKHIVIILICLCLVGTGVLLGNTAANMHEKADQDLLEENAFRIYYHEADNTIESNKSSLVIYGKSTPILTIDELGFNREGQKFTGWKVCCSDTRKWRIQTANGEKAWAKWLKPGDSFVLYEDGCSVKKAVKAGYTIHFYAEWIPE